MTKARTIRTRDPERTKNDILAVASEEFAERGYSGARIDEIAARTSSTKRMIYYYFGGKEGLYVAVLERAYQEVRDAEREIDVAHSDPVTSIRLLAERSFDHHMAHQEFVKLVALENVNDARFLSKIESLSSLGTPALDFVTQILERGWQAGVFRRDVTALDVHLAISAYCVFPVASGRTFGHLFDIDLLSSESLIRMRSIIGDLIVQWLTEGTRAPAKA
ncbi:TetR family transcriptional regulator [Ruicaihuangia caeni]|uniref:TetR/AcrR family transcriptional regulator n=1 Tax=Ruicaihuangia caeni TaxID=3042517 RepID=A0AAW6TCA6_9MICO|nr:TetR/AcrR family transcriptional regulator [Klugiella sp. YN-L-19]MDI2099222.1 TetR/AcrR family transcriptional regulator [Klugiella sp. YN-L-19]